MANGNSKRDKIDSFIRARVREALGEMALTSPSRAEWLGQNATWFCVNVAACIASDPYRMKELADIMAWKQPPEVK